MNSVEPLLTSHPLSLYPLTQATPSASLVSSQLFCGLVQAFLFLHLTIGSILPKSHFPVTATTGQQSSMVGPIWGVRPLTLHLPDTPHTLSVGNPTSRPHRLQAWQEHKPGSPLPRTYYLPKFKVISQVTLRDHPS